MPRLTKKFLGFSLDDKLVGVLTLGLCTQPRQTINNMFPGLESNDYYEIGKMCLSPELNGTKGAGSQMISATIRWMKENTDRLFLYTMADGIMGKCGYVYQASNFYFGEKYCFNFYKKPRYFLVKFFRTPSFIQTCILKTNFKHY